MTVVWRCKSGGAVLVALAAVLDTEQDTEVSEVSSEVDLLAQSALEHCQRGAQRMGTGSMGTPVVVVSGSDSCRPPHFWQGVRGVQWGQSALSSLLFTRLTSFRSQLPIPLFDFCDHCSVLLVFYFPLLWCGLLCVFWVVAPCFEKFSGLRNTIKGRCAKCDMGGISEYWTQ